MSSSGHDSLAHLYIIEIWKPWSCYFRFFGVGRSVRSRIPWHWQVTWIYSRAIFTGSFIRNPSCRCRILKPWEKNWTNKVAWFHLSENLVAGQFQTDWNWWCEEPADIGLFWKAIQRLHDLQATLQRSLCAGSGCGLCLFPAFWTEPENGKSGIRQNGHCAFGNHTKLDHCPGSRGHLRQIRKIQFIRLTQSNRQPLSGPTRPICGPLTFFSGAQA